jgi:hypothetical protein
MKPFVPEEFPVPRRFEHPEFILRPLGITDVIKDYDAVMSSARELKGLFGPGSNWPPPDLSVEQDLIDLGWHHKEFQRRSSFAYTMLSLDEQLCLGCVYLYPTDLPEVDVEVYFWVRTSHAAALDPVLHTALRCWLEDCWPFRRVVYPGRDSQTRPDGKRA